ncbi:DoxX family protein [Leptolyngbya sp. FACHB-261]|uniref:DoxX family protein n=1 Tax=Leptolyngbya sp. FACHB-261 TaxID=2692806 RepID=UPI001687DD3B|nr:DoxX family protein [Leptolyngbya sp. FACHB-261]MBD2102197.1 DoxX family protein [Leptolyngbya sp. FACHB-261]
MTTAQRPTLVFTGLLQSDVAASTVGQLAWAVLRVIAGTVMIQHGLEKIGDIQGFADAYVSAIGLPFPIFFSYCAAFAELIGAPLVILGLFTRLGSLALLGTMSVAIYHHLLVAGLNLSYLELSLLYTGCFAFFLVNGGGRFSLDALIDAWLVRGSQARRLETLEASYTASEQILQSTEVAPEISVEQK